jgi:triosephosphate isomerase
MKKKFIVANWKMSPTTLAQAQEILESANDYLDTWAERKELSLVFCPPFTFIEEVEKTLTTSHLRHQGFLGAQDISLKDEGAFTGEISGPMLSKLMVRFVIIGHSERRWKLKEDNDIVNQKLKATIRNGMIPIVCLGERTRDDDFKKFLEEQTAKTFDGLKKEDINKCFIAYEPVWAISSNPDSKPDTPESAEESIATIKAYLKSNFDADDPKFLYGGSITSENVTDFMSKDDIDGVLVGGASVNKEEFVKILSKVAKIL